MIQKTFRKSKIATSLSLILGATILAPAHAEDAAPEQEVERIEVTGIRASLIKSMDIKRSAAGVVDAITSEDIGKFPDSNLAESLQRITGVSIDRSNAEGSKITVRGFGPEFNLVTLNGRQMPTVGGRSFDFGDIATEGVAGVEVYKTTKADLPSGGIGATVNILTARPLDSTGLKASVGVKGVMETSNVTGDDITPELSALFSNTFADDMFGVLVSASHQERNNREEYGSVDNWIPNVDISASPNATLVDNNQRADGANWYPQNMGYGISDNERTRTNGQVVLQFAPNDKITATLDYTYSKVEREANQNKFGIWYNNGGNVSAAEINENGTYVNVTEIGGDYATNVNRNTTENENKSLGLNIEWQVTDTLSLEFDAHDSSAVNQGTGLGHDAFLIIGNTSCGWCESAGPQFGPSTATIDLKQTDFNSELPIFDLSFLDPNGNPQAELTNADMGSLFGAVSKGYNENEMSQFQLKGTWVNAGDGALASINFGASHTEMDFLSTNAYSENLPAGWWNWSAQYFNDDMFSRVDTNGLLDGFSGGGSDKLVNYYMTADFDQLLNIWETIEDTVVPAIFNDGWPTELEGKYTAGPIDTDSRVNEVTTAFYGQLNFEDEFNNMPINLAVGLRYEETEVTAKALDKVATEMIWVNGNEWAYNYADSQSFSDGAGKTKEFLPSLDFNIELTEDLLARVSYSRSLARPSIGALRSNTSYNGNPKVGQRKLGEGDPTLKPYLSDNLDLSLEYYYKEGSYASIGYFKKQVENFIVTISYAEEFGGLRDAYLGERAETARAELIALGIQPSDQAIHDQINANLGLPSNTPITAEETDPYTTFSIAREVNLETGNMYGLELAVQHMFGESGFGFQANATLVHGDVEADRNEIEQAFALPGMSNSANFSAIYDKDGLSARLSYNWRDEFLSGSDQHNSPVFTESYSQWDVNVNYAVNDHLTVFFEGLNITEETQRAYVRFSEQFLRGAQFGARYNIGARYSF